MTVFRDVGYVLSGGFRDVGSVLGTGLALWVPALATGLVNPTHALVFGLFKGASLVVDQKVANIFWLNSKTKFILKLPILISMFPLSLKALSLPLTFKAGVILLIGIHLNAIGFYAVATATIISIVKIASFIFDKQLERLPNYFLVCQ